MKVKAHLIVSKGYSLAITASQWMDELLEKADEYNKEYHGEQWRTTEKQRAVVTVEFELPDSVFAAPPLPQSFPSKLVEDSHD